jgi:excinuclease ABC subunit C
MWVCEGVNQSLSNVAAELPTRPGCYLFKDRRNTVIYVGKALNLRIRVRQYLAGSDDRPMVPFLVRDAVTVDCVVTDTEKEALLLENTLIKKHRPRFNAKLRDDSNFLHLRIDMRKDWPDYQLVRTIRRDGARYFGPYASASKARQTLASLQRAFPLRTCSDSVLKSRRRPCLLHQMGRCVAPCVGLVGRASYLELAASSTLMLEGQTTQVIAHLRDRMEQHAERLEFEHAAKMRDLIASIESSTERQKVIDTRLVDRDVWGVFREGDRGAVAILPIRNGVMGEPRSALLPALVGAPEEWMSSLVNSGYPEHSLVPPEILLPTVPPDVEVLQEILSERRGKKVTIRAPQRGDKVKLVALAIKNAEVRYLRDTDVEERHSRAMASLAEVLELPEPPSRIECFDNSNTQGTDPVAAMAVFLEGRPARKEYRRYRIKTVEGSDDYASMREVLERRFRRARDSGIFPDLLLVDGGKGQLGVAVAVLEDLGIHGQAVAGISKPRTERRKGDRNATDKIVLPHRKDPLRLGSGHPGLRILQHIRDEAHNHAVRYHRKVRSKNQLVSVLEGIPGVGAARRKALLRALGSAEAVARADERTLSEVPGIGKAMASQIYAAFKG